jgi:hypothetical protein
VDSPNPFKSKRAKSKGDQMAKEIRKTLRFSEDEFSIIEKNLDNRASCKSPNPPSNLRFLEV